MSKKKNSSINIIWSIVEIVLCVAVLCTLAMPIFKGSYPALLGGTTIERVGMVDWLKTMVFEAENANAWAVITAILYMLTLLASFATLVLAVLNVFGVRPKKMPKLALEVLLAVFAILFVVSSAIYTGVDGFSIWAGTALSQSAGTSYSVVVSWAGYVAMLGAIGACIAKAFEK